MTFPSLTFCQHLFDLFRLWLWWILSTFSTGLMSPLLPAKGLMASLELRCYKNEKTTFIQRKLYERKGLKIPFKNVVLKKICKGGVKNILFKVVLLKKNTGKGGVKGVIKKTIHSDLFSIYSSFLFITHIFS